MVNIHLKSHWELRGVIVPRVTIFFKYFITRWNINAGCLRKIPLIYSLQITIR